MIQYRMEALKISQNMEKKDHLLTALFPRGVKHQLISLGARLVMRQDSFIPMEQCYTQLGFLRGGIIAFCVWQTQQIPTICTIVHPTIIHFIQISRNP